MRDQVAEVSLEHGATLEVLRALPPIDAPRARYVADVVRELEEARERGVRVVLVSVDSPGGVEAAGYALYHAFRTFSETGGVVVAYVAQDARSVAVPAILGADYVVAQPLALIWPHGVVVPPQELAGAGEALMLSDRDASAVLGTHTLAPRERIERWLAVRPTPTNPGGERLSAETAQELGFVDVIGCRGAAEDLARSLARGEEVASPRRAALAQRGPPPELAEALRDVRHRAMGDLALALAEARGLQEERELEAQLERAGEAERDRVLRRIEWAGRDPLARLAQEATEFLAPRHVRHQYIDARTHEDELTRKVSKFFAEKWDALPKRLQERRYERDLVDVELVPFPEDLNRDGATRDRQWVWMVALNMGNRSNMERLLGGYGWTEANVRMFLDRNLTDDEWTFLEGVWDLLDRELYPEVAKAYEKVNGIKPSKIEALPFTLASGRVIRGGYFPARYDPVASRVGADQSVEAITKLYAQKAGAFSVAKSFTKERVKRFEDVINLQWSIVPSHVANVIHYVAFDAFVRDAARVLNHPVVQRTVEQRLGTKYRPQLEAWLRTVATAQADAIPEQLEDMYHPFLEARSRFVIQTLGYSLTVAAGDFTNPLVAIASGRVKGRYMAPVLVEALARYRGVRRGALEKSPELRHRSENLRHLLQTQLAEIGRRGKRNVVSRLVEGTRETAWVFMEWTDRLTSTVIWEGAYRQAAAKGLPEADAVAEADAAVRAMLPTHDAAEQPAFLRDKRGMGSLVAFYGYFSKLYNVQRHIWHEPLVEWESAEGFRESLAVAPSAAHAAGRALAVFFVANVVSEFITGRGPEEDEDWDEWMARKLLASPFGLIPLVGALGEEAAARLTSLLWQGEAKHRQYSVRASPAAAGLERLVRAIARIADEEKEVDDRLWALLEAFGFLFKTPVGSRQVSRTGRYVTSGELVEDLEAGEFGQVAAGLVYGDRERQPLNPGTALDELLE